ncbi:MAG: NADH-ubiquinone oxidoreductase-F iron-sulfur binding region domain-containing protein [Patescibacteria group bacterium]
MVEIIKKLAQYELIGRGCCNFPTATKWQMVLDAPGQEKYIVCNVSEGEPAVFKDQWVLENKPEIAIEAIKFALSFFKAKKAIIYLRHDYYQKYQLKLKKLIGRQKIELFQETAGYIGGEETALIESLENHRVMPRLKPPYPPQAGLFGAPTLVNNLETFYNIGLILRGEYEQKRLICISGAGVKPQVYELPEQLTMAEILKTTNTYPKFPFFVQAGGGAAGTVLNSSQLDKNLKDFRGLGSIVIHRLDEDQKKLFLNWLQFFRFESCGQCVPCREGTYRLVELLSQPKVDWPLFKEILFSLENTSSCGLGMAVPIAIKSYWQNVKE